MARGGEIRLAVLEGDGIGPEITDATVQVLKAAARRAGLGLKLKAAAIGWKAYRKSRTTLPDETIRTLRGHEGWIVGPTFAGEYPKDDPYRGPSRRLSPPELQALRQRAPGQGVAAARSADRPTST